MTKDVSKFDNVTSWIIDLDNTLYHAKSNLWDQIDVLMGRFISTHLGLDLSAAKKLQKSYLMSHGTTLRGLMDNHGVDPDYFLDYVHDLDLSSIGRDDELSGLLGHLKGRKIIYTNGSVGHARRVLDCLGVGHHFETIFDIKAADYVPKPRIEPMETMVRNQKVEASRAAMIDDMAVNLKPAHDMGMTTVWIETDSPYGRTSSEGDHVHHVAPDLKDLLKKHIERTA
ncbi:MAG: pyrimidine 5'-nucleotidase [Sphingomonadales bacterium]|jgi:putative hydrolase of the HAD superfamily